MHQILIQLLKGPPRRAVHQREGDDSRRDNSPLQCEDHRKSHARQESAQQAVFAEDQQKEVANHRRRQHHRQGEEAVDQGLPSLHPRHAVRGPNA